MVWEQDNPWRLELNNVPLKEVVDTPVEHKDIGECIVQTNVFSQFILQLVWSYRGKAPEICVKISVDGQPQHDKLKQQTPFIEKIVPFCQM